MSEFQDLIPCEKCKKIPYDILMLSCHHDLCVRCASEIFSSQHRKNAPGKIFLECERCHSKTPLDDQSVKQLNNSFKKKSLKTKNEKTQYYEKQDLKRQNTINLRESESEFMKKEQINFKPEMLKTIRTQMSCEVHPEEPVMYYCFHCKQSCFCAQCVLHGNYRFKVGKHMEHDVKIVKKAYSQIEAQLRQISDLGKLKLKILSQKRKQIISDINSMKVKTDSMKKLIEKAFDEIRQVLRGKQLQYMKFCDRNMQKSLQVLNSGNKKKLQEKIKDTDDFIRNFDGLLKKGQVPSLNVYSEFEREMIRFVQQKQMELKENQFTFDNKFLPYIREIKEQIQKLKPPQ